jgi:ribosomal protein L16 Arg81 hydroxylase
MNALPLRFGSLIAPMAADDFFHRYWERRPLHIERGGRIAADAPLTLVDLSRMLSDLMFRADEVKVAQDGRIVPPQAYLRAPGMPVMGRVATDHVDAARLLALFERGATLVFPQLDHKWPVLRRMARELQHDLGATVLTNVFLSNRHAQGFSMHYDTHDVFVLQLAGRKQWSVHDSPIDLPLKSQAFGRTGLRAGPPALQVTLQAGDLLYVPRGYFHEARTEGDVSLHLTLGVHPYLWVDHLADLVREAGLRLPALRRSVAPRSGSVPPHERLQHLQLLLATLAGSNELAGASDRLFDLALQRQAGAGEFAPEGGLRLAGLGV